MSQARNSPRFPRNAGASDALPRGPGSHGAIGPVARPDTLAAGLAHTLPFLAAVLRPVGLASLFVAFAVCDFVLLASVRVSKDLFPIEQVAPRDTTFRQPEYPRLDRPDLFEDLYEWRPAECR